MIIPFLAFCLVATCNAELRTWTAVNGKEVEAEFVSNNDGQVSLKMKTGKIFKVPLNKLSKADQDFIVAQSSSDSPTKPFISEEDVKRFAEDAVHFDTMHLQEGLYYQANEFKTPYSGWSFVSFLGFNVKQQLSELVQWKNGKSDGTSMLFYASGKIESIHIYKEGESVQGHTWYESGEKALEMILKEDGTRKGRGWHLNGKKGVEVTLEAGADEDEVKGKFWNSKGEPVGSMEETGIEKVISEMRSKSMRKSFPRLDAINLNELEFRGFDSVAYLIDSDTPYTGNSSEFYENGRKKWVKIWVDGKLNGTSTKWHENGEKIKEVNYKDDKEISAKYWNSKGEPVDALTALTERKQRLKEEEFLTAKPSLEEIPVKALHYEVEGDDVTITNYLYWEQFEGKQRVAHGLSGKGSGAWAIPKLIKGKAVTHIGADAFRNESMSHLEVPNSVVKIERRAFHGMEYLNSIVIGAGVESIGNQAFWFSKRLAAVTFLGDAPSTAKNIFYGATFHSHHLPQTRSKGLGRYI